MNSDLFTIPVAFQNDLCFGLWSFETHLKHYNEIQNPGTDNYENPFPVCRPSDHNVYQASESVVSQS